MKSSFFQKGKVIKVKWLTAHSYLLKVINTFSIICSKRAFILVPTKRLKLSFNQRD